MKKAISLLMAGIMLVMCLAGCSSGNSDSKSSTGKSRATTGGKETNTLTVALVDTVTSFDPDFFAKQSEDGIIRQVYDSLFYLDNDSNIVPLLMDSYTENADGSVSFALKEGLKFHSGDTVKSEDVEYSLLRSENSTLSSILSQTVTMTIEDDTHFTWSFPLADTGAGFADLLPYIQLMAILNKSFCEANLSDINDNLGLKEDGAGPYVLESVADNGDVTLKRFEDYYEEVPIETLKGKLVTGSVETAFEAGDIDEAMYGATNYNIIKEYTNVYSYPQPANNVGFLTINCADGKPGADFKVRQAVAYALNKPDVVSVATDDAGMVADNLATPLVEYYTEDVDKYERDVEKSKSLMTEAGYSDSSRLTITLIVASAYQDWVSASEVIKENMEESYFTVNIEEVPDTSRYFTGDFDIGFIAIGLTTKFASYAGLFDPASGLDLSLFEDQAVTDAFAAITDEATTQAAMKTATGTLAYIPLFYPTVFLAFDADLEGTTYLTNLGGFLYKMFSWKK